LALAPQLASGEEAGQRTSEPGNCRGTAPQDPRGCRLTGPAGRGLVAPRKTGELEVREAPLRAQALDSVAEAPIEGLRSLSPLLAELPLVDQPLGELLAGL